MNKEPLCVDCDGTLIKSDLLFEALLLAIKQSPLNLFRVLFWVMKGRANLKFKLSQLIDIDVSLLPYNHDVLELIKNSREKKIQTILVTASPLPWARDVAGFLGVFDDVIASDDNINLKGKSKANILVQRFGEKGFSYIGDSKSDIPVWKKASESIIVSGNQRKLRRLKKNVKADNVLYKKSSTVKSYIKALRIYQWIKNILIFLPLLASHKFTNIELLIKTSLAFFAFSFCASAGYIINDLMDLDADRQHDRKKKRPFASGTLPISSGIILVPLLIVSALIIAFQINLQLSLLLILYLFCTVSYSLVLKKQVIVDVVLLAGLYTLRILVGSAATGITSSFWILAFSMFLFLCLANVKRYSELYVLSNKNKEDTAGRGYRVNDLPFVMSAGISSGMGSILVFALYINNDNTSDLYANKYWLWCLAPVLLYWVNRLWMKAHRGEIHDDPIIFAVKDWQSRVVLLLSLVFIILAI